MYTCSLAARRERSAAVAQVIVVIGPSTVASVRLFERIVETLEIMKASSDYGLSVRVYKQKYRDACNLELNALLIPSYLPNHIPEGDTAKR